MIYLDYAADTPVSDEVLDVFVKMQKAYIANPNAAHGLGQAAKEKLQEITEHTAKMLNVLPEEIIYTSGATESNNLAVKNVLKEYKRYGKHVITTMLEHSSVTGPFSAMQEEGFEVEYVNVKADGTVDLEHLKELLREDTIIVSTVYVESECGSIQPIHEIAQLVHEKPHCLYHIDATQAIGKIPVDLSEVDLATMTAHKINGLHGVGLLIKKKDVRVKALHSGGLSTTPFRSGTPSLALAASFEKALEVALMKRQTAFEHVKVLNERLKAALKKYEKVKINSAENASPFILNISVLGVKAMVFASALEEEAIYISTKSACTIPNTPSRAVFAMTGDRKRAMATLRISLSDLTTDEEITAFLESFDKHYHELVE